MLKQFHRTNRFLRIATQATLVPKRKARLRPAEDQRSLQRHQLWWHQSASTIRLHLLQKTLQIRLESASYLVFIIFTKQRIRMTLFTYCRMSAERPTFNKMHWTTALEALQLSRPLRILRIIVSICRIVAAQNYSTHDITKISIFVASGGISAAANMPPSTKSIQGDFIAILNAEHVILSMRSNWSFYRKKKH